MEIHSVSYVIKITRSVAYTYNSCVFDKPISFQLHAYTTGYSSPTYVFDKLQSVLNAAARLISKRRFESVTPLLRDLHWLRVPQRVEYKLSVLVHRCLHNLAPQYLYDELRRVADISSRQIEIVVNVCTGRTANSAVHRR